MQRSDDNTKRRHTVMPCKSQSQMPNVTHKNDQKLTDARTTCSHAEARTDIRNEEKIRRLSCIKMNELASRHYHEILG